MGLISFLTSIIVMLTLNTEVLANTKSNLNLANQDQSIKIYNIDHLQTLLKDILSKDKIIIKMLGKSVILTGSATGIDEVEKIEKIIHSYFNGEVKILNFIKITGSQQVMLRVRIGEVKQNLLINHQEGMNYDLYQKKGLIRTIAEPNLVAMTGQKAEFLAGGEFPVPVQQKDGNIAVKYKTHGIKMTFIPNILAANRIRINVEQQLSELIPNNQVAISGINLPHISSRRAKTTIELAPGQSFMIAGLVRDDQYNKTRNASELVISITPYLVNPVQNKDLNLPTDEIYQANQLEKDFIKAINKSVDESKLPSGPIGFIAE